jgi:V/A-type H+-transporting ATPase subunit C
MAYAYFNARVKAMQGRLLPRERYHTLLAQATFDGLVESLRDTPYAAALERSADEPTSSARSGPAATFDEALRRELSGTVSKVRRLASDRPRELMDAVLLRWDAYNLKTILRGKRAAASIEEMLASTFPVGVLDDPALAELSRAPTMKAVLDTLATWRMPLARPLREGLRLLGETESLQSLELGLDRFVFAHAFGVAADGDDQDAVVRRYLRQSVDRVNVLTALRCLEERSLLSPLGAGRHFLDPGGRFTRARYEAVVGARDLRHGLSLLAETPFHWLATTVAEGQPISIPALERRLDRALMGEAIALSRCDPLGIGVAVAYVERKIDEVRNLRMIAQGKSVGLDAEQIAEWLIM